MSNLIIPPDWALPESAAVSEWMYTNRRRFLRQLGYTGGGLAALLAGCGGDSGQGEIRAGDEEAGGGPLAGGQDPTSQPADAEVAGAGPEGEVLIFYGYLSHLLRLSFTSSMAIS